MPLIAALTPREHHVWHTDEIVESARFDTPADLVGITAPTPSALHAWVARRFYSPRSIARRLAGSRAGLWWSLARNAGYMLAGLSNAGPWWDPAEPEQRIKGSGRGSP